jgi:3-phosphoshikimate 1-carboxyvinyltransferase
MNVTIEPKKLTGSIHVISSKSLSHRYVIASALAQGVSKIHHVLDSFDLHATKEALTHFGALFKGDDITGCDFSYDGKDICCKESGSTLRFMIPIAMLQEKEVRFTGQGRLPDRPLDIYKKVFGDRMSFESDQSLPCLVKGPLIGKDYQLKGDVSSQFITGLLFALPKAKEDSTITWTTPLASRGYIDLTLDVLNQFGIHIKETEKQFIIKGNQHYQPIEATVEGDFSQAAFWIAAGLLGEVISLYNLNPSSKQGDAEILSIVKKMGGDIFYDKNHHRFTINPSHLKGSTIDLNNIPDLGPILMVLAAFAEGITHFTHISRLRIKESDRVEAMYQALTKCGIKMEVKGDEAWITGQDEIEGHVILDGFNDHRIVMACAMLSIKAKNPITITHAEAIHKSYPTFFEEFQSLGGIIHELK